MRCRTAYADCQVILHLSNYSFHMRAATAIHSSSHSILRYRARIESEPGVTIMISASTVQGLVDRAVEVVHNGLRSFSPQKKTIPTFAEYVEHWLKDIGSKRIESTTLGGYRSYANTFNKSFGNLKINEISFSVIQDFLNEHSNHKESTNRKYLKFLSELFDFAISEGYAEKNPTQNKLLFVTGDRKTTRDALTLDQFQDIIANLGKLEENDRLYILLIMYTGMRKGEALALRYSDVDHKAGMIRLTRQLRFPNGQNQGEIVEYLKMGHAGRNIPIPAQLKPWLEKDTSDRLLFGDDNKPMSMQQYRNKWTRITKKIDLHGATAHALQSLQALAGHSSCSFTMNQYVHAQDDQLLKAGEKNSRFLPSIPSEAATSAP